MPTLIDAIAAGRAAEAHRPCPRVVVDEALWQQLASQLAAGRYSLLGLWGDRNAVHMALFDEGETQTAVVTLPCPDGHFPSVGQIHPPAIRPERALRDLFGIEPRDMPDARPWFDHGRWDVRHP